MFGYIRPYTPELRVRDHAFYRAAYCGVCRQMERQVSPLLSFSLRYDFVLLAAVRMLLTGEMPEARSCRCTVNPLRKHQMLGPSPAMTDTAFAAALLTYRSLLDHISDERGLRRLGCRLLLPPAAAMRSKVLRRAPAFADLDTCLEEQLAALTALERAGESSPDAAAEPFSTLLGAVFAHGLDSREARIARSVGESVGRYIYLLDAVDDAPRDEKSGAYNPFVLQSREESISVTEYLSAHRVRIESALLLSCRTAASALVLADEYDTHPTWPCIENILTLGMPHMASEVLDSPGAKRKTRGSADIVRAGERIPAKKNTDDNRGSIDS